MNFPDALFPDTWQFAAFCIFVPVLLWCIATAPWRRLAESSQSNLWLGTIVLLALVWSMKAGVKPGLNMHLLGATMFALMFGRELALIGLALVLAAVTFNLNLQGQHGWQSFGLNALVLAVVPTLLADLIRRTVERHLPHNLFVYIFVSAFFGAALAALASGFFATMLLALAGVYPLPLLFDEYFPYYLLLGFSEAWLNGAMVTMMVIYMPHWVGTFDDKLYQLKK
jgi:uncharacterized membrane protein